MNYFVVTLPPTIEVIANSVPAFAILPAVATNSFHYNIYVKSIAETSQDGGTSVSTRLQC